MHVINRFFLKLALLPIRMYQRMGVDPVHLKIILTTKLLLDDRRPQPISQMRRRQKKQVSMATLSTMFMSALMGGFFIFCFLLGSDKVTQLTFYFTFFFVLLSLTLITDFTSVLIDVRDNFILLPKPVNDKTIVMARLLHIFIHLCKIVLPMGLPGVIYVGYTVGVYGAILLLCLILLLTAFSIFCINAVYIAILKFTTPERFRSIITYVQIIFAIVVYGSYQFFPRLISAYGNEAFSLTQIRWMVLYPLYWMANSWNLLFTFHGSTTAIVTAVIGILFPLAGIFVVINYLAPSFNRKLALLTGTDSTPKRNSAARQAKQRTIANSLSRIFTGSTVEKASFLFTWKMTARSRDFKLKVYPSIGYMIVIAVVFFLKDKSLDLSNLRANPKAARGLLLSTLYFSDFLLLMAVGQVVYSDKYKASWIFYTSPLEKPGHIVSGAAKALLLKFFAPVAVIISLAAVMLASADILPNLIFGISNCLLVIALVMVVNKQALPFSMQQSNNVKAGTFMKSLFVMILAGGIAVGHVLVYSMLPVVVILTVLSMLANWLLFSSLRQISWEKILSTVEA